MEKCIEVKKRHVNENNKQFLLKLRLDRRAGMVGPDRSQAFEFVQA